jgi:serine/threonine protein kinase
MIGKQILNYRVESLLGEGGMGSVYLAVHIQLNRKVAIKALNPSLVKNSGIRARFKNEAATLSQLQHPNIVILFDYLEEEEALYLIMEYVEGKTLEEYIQMVSGPIPEIKAIPLFVQVLDGFAYAHEQGVVHRDVKPANIMITAREKIKILDFGIAKLLSQKSHTLTQTGVKMGTVLYMSPEQVKGEKVDKRSDVYSLGVTLFQMLTGRGPYEDPDATEFAVYNKIVNEPLPLAKSFYPNISGHIQSIIDKATAKNPNDRFQDCQEFKNALQGSGFSFVGNTQTVYRPATSLPNAEGNIKNNTTIQQPVKQSTDNASAAKKPRSNSWLIGLFIALILAVGMWYISRSGEENKPTGNATNNQSNSSGKQPAEKGNRDDTQQETTPTERGSEPEIIAPEEVIRPDRQTGTGMIIPNINLYCEISDSENDNVRENIKVLIVLSNTSQDTAYENVSIKFTFYDEANNKVGSYSYDHGRLDAGQEERFLIDRKIRASRVECGIASAQAVQNTDAENMEDSF